MIRSCAPREAVPDALRAKFDEMARKDKEEKKVKGKGKGSGAKVGPEIGDDVAEDASMPATVLEVREVKQHSSGEMPSQHDSSGSCAGEATVDEGEEKTAEPNVGSEMAAVGGVLATRSMRVKLEPLN